MEKKRDCVRVAIKWWWSVGNLVDFYPGLCVKERERERDLQSSSFASSSVMLCWPCQIVSLIGGSKAAHPLQVACVLPELSRPYPTFLHGGGKIERICSGVGGEVKGGWGWGGRCPWSSKAHWHCAVSTCLWPEQGKCGECVQWNPWQTTVLKFCKR